MDAGQQPLTPPPLARRFWVESFAGSASHSTQNGIRVAVGVAGGGYGRAMAAIDAVLAVNDAFYAAHETRDLDAMGAVWEHAQRIVCVHPGWPILRGWPAVEDSWMRIFAGAGRTQFILTNQSIDVGDELAWITLEENLVDRGETSAIAATNVYARTDAGWRMIAHHGSPVLAVLDRTR